MRRRLVDVCVKFRVVRGSPGQGYSGVGTGEGVLKREMALVARNGLWLTKAVPDDASLFPRASGMIEAVATGRLRLASLSSSVSVDAGGQLNVITVGSNSVVLQANLDVRGTINATQTNDLYVRDRLICVANMDLPYGVGEAPVDLTDGAGLLVGNSESEATPSEVSMRWHKPAVAGRQPVWELIGGCWRLTRVLPSTGDSVSYSFTISDSGELEVSRRTAPFGADEVAAKYQHVAVYGRPATGARPASTGISLPTSVNQFGA